MSRPLEALGGRVALVTGASSGIGAAIARAFSAHGASVHLSGIDTTRLTRVADGLAPDRTMWTALDLSETERVASLVSGTIDHFGRLDVLVNCGAVVGRHIRLAAGDTSLDTWNTVMAVNVTAPFILSTAALTAFRAIGGGSIINIASIGGLGAFPGFCAYVTSKAALIGLTRSMALDYGREGVRVNAIAPGAIDTAQVADEPDRPGYLARIGEMTAVGRIGEPEEIAEVAVFLAGQASSYLTGQVIVVDGGRTLRA
ncbi:MAG: SDR family oxidoreductase [Chloroflexi bacterium]|nr:SDR family oxidoreductase [Chloroflexota bacterium]